VNTTRRLWTGLAALLVISFGVLLDGRVSPQKRRYPNGRDAVSGEVIFTRSDIETGRVVWQSIGGMQLGSIWGHGALVAPDWSADWMHREGEALADHLARQTGQPFAQLSAEQQESVLTRVRRAQRANTLEPASSVLRVSQDRAAAIAVVSAHYEGVFGDDPAFQSLRETYAMRDGTVADAQKRRQLSAFVFWTAWAAITERPGSKASYTSNWPYEPALGNTPTSSTFIWSVFSIVFMLAGIGLLAWHYVARHVKEPELSARLRPAREPGNHARRAPPSILGDGAVPPADPARRDHGALPGGARVLWRGSLAVAAVLGHAQLAHAAGRAMDRHRVARHGAVYRACHLRT
jgi:nitric oxide reductase subunit B